MMAKQYNYIFYLTVRTLNWCSNKLIIRPLIKLLEVFSVSDKRIQNVKKGHLIRTESYKDGNNVNYAFRLMMWTLTCFVLTIGLLIIKAYDPDLENKWIVIFSFSVILSIVINYTALWKSDRYEKYFLQFKKEKRTNSDYFVASLYHLTITAICIGTAMYL
jgi:hypothetical protein